MFKRYSVRLHCSRAQRGRTKTGYSRGVFNNFEHDRDSMRLIRALFMMNCMEDLAYKSWS